MRAVPSSNRRPLFCGNWKLHGNIRDSVELAALVFHEMGHNTLYVKSATAFNESFAQMVGYRAAEAFYRTRGDSVLANRARSRWEDEIILAGYYRKLIDTLTTFYDSKPRGDSLEAGRRTIGQWSKGYLETAIGPQLTTYRIGRLADRPINNAQLVGVLLYRTHLDWFERWFARHGNLGASVTALRDAMKGVEGDDAFKRLEAALQ